MKSKENAKKTPTMSGWPSNPIRLKTFLDKNPTLWAVAWAILWRIWVIGFGIYFSAIIVVTILIGFARGLAFLLS